MLKPQKYYLSGHSGNVTLLHCAGCSLIPKSLKKRTFIGTCYTVNQAMTVAATRHSDVQKCMTCVGNAGFVPFEGLSKPVSQDVTPRPKLSKAKKSASAEVKPAIAARKKKPRAINAPKKITGTANATVLKIYYSAGLDSWQKEVINQNIRPAKHFL